MEAFMYRCHPQTAKLVQLIGAGAIGDNEVEAISGATLTCDKVQDMLNAVIEGIAGEKQLWQMID